MLGYIEIVLVLGKLKENKMTNLILLLSYIFTILLCFVLGELCYTVLCKLSKRKETKHFDYKL